RRNARHRLRLALVDPAGLLQRAGPAGAEGSHAAGRGGRRPAALGVRGPRVRTAGPAAVIGRDGSKESADLALNHWDFDQAHVGAYDPKVRLTVLDECGIDAQVIFPSSI